MRFASPWLLLALLAVPATVAFALAVDRRRSRYGVVFTNLDVLGDVVARRRSWRRWVPLTALVLALGCAATAVARPTAMLTSTTRGGTIVFLVDVSGSMRATDVEPTRLDAAVNAIRALVERLPRRFKVGLVAFSTEPEVLVRPTLDRGYLDESLAYLTPETGTALGDGLAAAVKLTVSSLGADGVRHTPHRYLPAAIVLESDGQQNSGRLQPVEAARLARAAGVRVEGVALGTAGGSLTYRFDGYTTRSPVPPDPATVRLISRVTGGRAYAAASAGRLVDVYRTLGSSIGRTRSRHEIGSWLAGAAAALLLASLIGGRLAEGRLP